MKKFILLEEEKSEIKSMYGLTEAPMTPPAPVRPTTVMDTLSVTPNKLLFQNSTNNNNTIFLSIRDAAGKKIPNTTYKYKIGGSFIGINFNVNVRNLKRDEQGNLTGEALPSNSSAAWLMRQAMPDDILTEDDWLKILVPNEKLNQGIQSLKSTKGQTAKIDAGQGVSITLQYIGK
jgi:hypothetical protein